MKKILVSAALAVALIGLDLYVLRAAEGGSIKFKDREDTLVKQGKADAAVSLANVGTSIKNNLLDQSRVQTQLIQLQAQYNNDQQTLQKDQDELKGLNTQALTAAELDAATNSVDDEKLEFTAKPKPAPETKK